MAEDWAAVVSDVADALASAGFAATLHSKQSGPDTPWSSTALAFTDYPVNVLDTGIRQTYGPDGLLLRRYRTLMMGADTVAPKISDRVTVRGTLHEVQAVYPIAPGGADLFFRVEINA
ncbi:MAG: hypothetical protein EBR82_40040 [Caulobacteraceae bacterium]|nr:hypothetical protein [Caulobacteraceae bacterium]